MTQLIRCVPRQEEQRAGAIWSVHELASRDAAVPPPGILGRCVSKRLRPSLATNRPPTEMRLCICQAGNSQESQTATVRSSGTASTRCILVQTALEAISQS